VAQVRHSRLTWGLAAVLGLEVALALTVPAAARWVATDPGRHPPVPAAPSPAPVRPLPVPGDLTVAGAAGDTLVGLTRRPGAAGRDLLLLYLDPPASRATLSVGGAALPLVPCGPSCLGTTLAPDAGTAGPPDAGTARVTVTVPGQGSARLDVPAASAPDATALTGRALRTMATLRSYRVEEDLSGVRSSYTFRRPDRMWMRLWLPTGPRDSVWAGGRVMRRSGPHAAWGAPQPAAPVPVPYFSWQAFEPLVAARLLTPAGTRVAVVSAFGGHGDDPEPVWFTLWIDTGSGRVLRSTMWAPGHLMDDRYADFDRPVTMPDLPEG
jgi:hypothetical protein